MFLREYVYVDPEKVQGLAGQLYDGVPERAVNVAGRRKSLVVDAKVVNWGNASSTEESTERALVGSLFKDLEADLEALGVLSDVTEVLQAEDAWARVEEVAAPGKILRITSEGTLFHPAQLSDAIVGIATAAEGLEDLDSENDPEEGLNVPPGAKTAAQKKASRAGGKPQAEPRFPEDFLPLRETIPVVNTSRRALAGMIKVTRGVFGEGVHLHLRPRGPEGPVVTSRLEEGRQFLDSSPEVLISRYGLAQQEWTVVGIVGQIGAQENDEEYPVVTNADGSVNRAKFVDVVGKFLQQTNGLIDLPQHPGFSIIPIAVYRTIGESILPESKRLNS